MEKSKGIHMTLASKLAVIILSIIVASSASIGVFSYVIYRGDSIAHYEDKAVAIAQSLAQFIDPDEFLQIMESGEKNDYYIDLQNQVDRLRDDVGALFLFAGIADQMVGLKVFMEGTVVGLGDTFPAEAFPSEFFNAQRGVAASAGVVATGVDDLFAVAAYVPVFDASNRPVGVVGININVTEVFAHSNSFAWRMLGIVALVASVLIWIPVFYLRRSVTKPLALLQETSQQFAQGRTNIDIANLERKDEIGKISNNFKDILEAQKTEVSSLEQMLNHLNAMFSEINDSAIQISNGSQQIAGNASELSKGATEQSAVIAEFSSSIESIQEQTKKNAAVARDAADMTNTIRANAEKGSTQMDNMIQAVTEINAASNQISKVIKIIDDIAFQTNILALNAAVEAARAGQHGKGFAVVAEEVRNLAAKSAEAASDTGRLIENSVSKANLGMSIAEETAESLKTIVAEINRNTEVIEEIASKSDEQSVAIGQLNAGIEKMSHVITQNSTAAAENSASSQEISAQADMLESLIAQSKLKKEIGVIYRR